MRSSPPGKAPKSQLAIEKSRTGRHWNLQKKDNPRPKTNKKQQQDGRRGTVTIKSNPNPLGG